MSLGRRTWLRRWVAIGFAAAAVPALCLGAKPPGEYDVKAAFLYNLGKFVRWPPEALGETNAPFVIGVLGGGPLTERLEASLAGKTIQERPIVVKRSENVNELLGCHVLYIAPGSEADTSYVMSRLAGRPVLTVGEGAKFVSRGGMVGFVVENRRLRFDINIESARGAGLEISSQVIRLARNVLRKETS
jgi:hypothetical protein